MRVVQLLLIQALLISSILCGEGDPYDKRCRYFDFLRACKVGCKVLGHTTGVCDENDKCWCSEEDYNFFHDVSQWLGDLDIEDVIDRQVNKFKRKIDEWDISDKVKSLVPSKCKISQEFCSKACHAIGRVSGTCNADFTDCDCEGLVTPREYGLCAVETICKLHCQRKGYARGDCKGDQGWNCVCISQNDVEVEAKLPEETVPRIDPDAEIVEYFDA